MNNGGQKMIKYKGKEKYIAAIVAAAIVALPVLSFNSQAAEVTDPNIIYQNTKKQTVTKGVTIENIVKFTKNGWYNINVMTVDLSNKYISVDSLTNTESIGKLATTKKLATQRNAVAAVNASFFTPDGGGYGHPLGTVVQSSDILCASSDFNRYSDAIASFSIDKLNNAIINYWKVNMNLITRDGEKIPVAQYNKYNNSKFKDITVFDRKWGTKAVGATEDIPDLFQMVVENGVVTKFLSGQPAAEIPENGYVVVTREEGAKTLRKAFSIGNEVTFSIETTPSWTDLKMSVSGSSVLVQNGKIPATFSYAPSDVVAKSPKTAIGASKDGKTLYFVTVDGRQTASIGFSLNEMAQFMKSIGAYNAINMDGGGSTTIVARPEGSREVQVMNLPSDGSQRGISTAVGVFTSAPEAPLAGLIVETSDRYIFTNTSREFTVKGYDQYNNPVDVDLKDVKWSVSGVKGKFVGNVFYPTTYGTGKVTAKIGKIQASLEFYVLSKPAVIKLSTNTLKLPVGQTKTFTITGINPRGYSATIDPKDVKWTVSSKIGSFKDGVFTAEKRGSGYIKATVGDVSAYCALSISSDVTKIVDTFEKANGKFSSYPDYVKGDYSISSEQKASGKYSGKLTYEFANTGVTRAAYMVLSNGGIKLDEDASKISLKVYNSHENSGWLRATIIDANGKEKPVDLSRTMDFTGWKTVEASLDGIQLPGKLTRIYLAQVNPTEDAGSLYFDDLSITYSGYPAIDMEKIPKDTPFKDEANIAVSFTKATADSFRFGVLGQTRAPGNDLEKNLVKKFADKITKYLELGAVVGSGSHESLTGLVTKKPVVATHTVDLKSTKAVDYQYSVTDFKNSRFIKLDTRKKSLRLSDTDQWHRFLNDLKSFKGKNVFIFMENSPETFTDKLEMNLFKETISDYRLDTLRNVWVFFNGGKNESYMENGVKYLSTCGYEVPGLKAGNTNAAQYILVTVKGSNVTYVYKPIES